ncbi:MAG: hypothetical protein Q8R28_20040, partial [Dehalococcoidia bacterium]|nr:hypothetical protein [Dehalococcoidia bacterium]
MAERKSKRSLSALALALVLSTVVLGGVFLGGRLTDTASAATGDLGGWTATTPLTVPTWAFAAAASSSYVYVSGGEITTTGSIAEFSGTLRAAINAAGSLGPWENQTFLSVARIDHGMIYTETAAGNRCLYVVGGYTGPTPSSLAVTRSVEFALVGSDGAIGAWAQTESMNTARAHFGVAVYNGRIYALGGDSSVEFTSINNDCTLASPWLNTTSMTSIHSSNRAFAANGFLYSTGDFSETLAAGVQYAPINSDGTLGPAWAAASSMNQKRGDHAVIANTRAGYVYALGGMATSPLTRTATVERASLNSNGTLGTWSLVTGLPSPGEDMAFAQANGRIYMLGGSSGGITNTVYFSAIDGAGPPDLSNSSKQVSGASATPGQALTYTVVLSNTGRGSTTARITDTLPVSVTYSSGSASNGATYDAASRSIRWSGVVTVGTPLSITYRAVITSPLDNGSLITNTASINDGNGSVFDTAPVTTTISSVPDLSSSTKTVKRPISGPGGTVGYNIVVSNTGTMNIPARVTDTLPLSLTYVANSLQSTMGTSLYDSSTGSVLWAGPALVGVPVTISYQARVPASAASGATIANAATIHGTGGAPRETPPVTVTVASNPSRIGWQNLGLYGARTEDVAIDPTTGVVLLASGGTTGVYRSVDGGKSWLPSTDFGGCLRLLLDESSGTAYASCRPEPNKSGLWKSTDGGLAWAPVLSKALYPAFSDGEVTAVAMAGTTLYVADWNGGVWASTDAGQTWTRRAVTQSTPVNALAAEATAPAVVYAATSTKAFRSANAGASWTEMTPNGSITDLHSIAVNPHNPGVVFIGTGADGGNRLYKSVDSGLNWTTISLLSGSVSWIEFHPSDANTLFTQHMRSIDNGDTWQGFNVGGGGMAIDRADPNIIYGGSTQGAHKSIDGGATWTEIDTGLEEVAVTDVAQNSRDANAFFIASTMGFGRTLDSGANWAWPLDLNALPQPDMFGYAVAVEPSAAYLSGGNSILGRSTDNGATWSAGNLQQVVQNDLGMSGRPGVGDIGLAPGETGHLFAAVRESPEGNPTPKGGVYESTDSGLTWTSTGLTGVPVNTIGFATSANGAVIYAGVGDSWGRYAGAGSVYTSAVGSTSVWRQTTISTTAPIITKLQVDPTNPLVVYAGGGFVRTGV